VAKKLSAIIEVVTGKSIQVIDALRSKIGFLEKDLSDGDLNQTIDIKTGKATQNVGKLRNQVEQLKKQTQSGIVYKNAGTALSGYAKRLGVAAAAAFTAKKAFNLTIGATLSFGKSFLDVTKNVQASEQQLKNIRAGILDISSASGQSAENIAAIAAAVGRTGASADQIIPLVITANQVAIAFEVGAEQAVAFLSAAKKSFDLDNQGALELADSINNLGKNFATSEAQILNFVQRVAPFTSQLELTAEFTAGLGAALLDLQIPTEIAATAIRGVATRLGTIQSAGKAAQDSLKLLGTSGQELADSLDKDAGQAIRNLLTQLSELSRQDQSDAIKNIFGEEASKGVLALVGNLGNLDKALAASNDQTAKSGSVIDEFNKKVNSAPGAVDKARESVKNFGITLSETTEGPIADASNAISDFFGFLTEESRRAEANKFGLVTQIMNDSLDALRGIYRDTKKEIEQEPIAPRVDTSGLQELADATNAVNQASLAQRQGLIDAEEAENVQRLTDALVENVRVQLETVETVEQAQVIYDNYFKQFNDGVISVQQLDAVTNVLNNSQTQLITTTAQLAEAKRQETQATQAAREEAQRDGDRNQQIAVNKAASDKANQARADRAAREDQAATDRLKNRNKVLTSAGAGLAAIVNGLQQSVAKLSTKATAQLQRVSNEFRILGTKAREAADPAASLNDALNRLRFNQKLLPQASTFTKLLNTMAQAAQGVRVQFFRQELKAADLAEQLRKNTDATDQYVQFIEKARDGLDLLDDAQLTELNSEIDKARDKLDAMTNAANDATSALEDISEGLLNEIDSFSGNLEAIESRRFQQQLDNIQELRDVQGADSQAAVEAERLARQAHLNRLDEIKERAEAQAQSDRDGAEREREADQQRQAALQERADTLLQTQQDVTLSINGRTLAEELDFENRLNG
jgi:TP901 family phage tail tape measure protein